MCPHLWKRLGTKSAVCRILLQRWLSSEPMNVTV
jgi:hypothetical protein